MKKKSLIFLSVLLLNSYFSLSFANPTVTQPAESLPHVATTATSPLVPVESPADTKPALSEEEKLVEEATWELEEILEKNDKKWTVSKKEIVESLVGSEDKNHLKEIENKLKELSDKSESIEIKNKNLHQLESLVKDEIKSLNEKINANNLLGDEYKKIKKELEHANSKLQGYEDEILHNELQAEQLSLLVESYKELRDTYEDKIGKQNREKIGFVFQLIILWLVWVSLIEALLKFIEKKIPEKHFIDIKTGTTIMKSLLTIAVFSYSAVEVLQIFQQFFYLLLLVLWSLLVALKDYLQSLFAFIGKIAFKMKLGDYVMIDSKPCRIKNISSFFTLVEIYGEDLSFKGNKNYFNNEFIVKASALDIQELGVIHTLTYEVNHKLYSEELIQQLEKTLKTWVVPAEEKKTELPMLSLDNSQELKNHFLLSYSYTLNKKKNASIELALTIKSLKGSNREMMNLIQKLDELLLLEEDKKAIKDE